LAFFFLVLDLTQARVGDSFLPVSDLLAEQARIR